MNVDEKQFTDMANEMVENIMNEMQAVVNFYAAGYGIESAMHCFGSALAISSGNMLSMLCFGLADPKQRSPFMANFFKLLRESAEAHKDRTVAKQH